MDRALSDSLEGADPAACALIVNSVTRRAELPPSLPRPAFRVRDALNRGVAPGRLGARDLDSSVHGARIMPGGVMLDAVAAVLGDGQAFAGPTAAKIWGMPLPRRWEQDERLWVSTPSRDRAMRRPGVVGIRRSLAVATEHRGYRVLVPAHTWATLAGVLASHDLVAVADRIVTTSPHHRALASTAALQQVAGWPGRGRRMLQSALGESREGAWSRTESLLRVALTRAGIPEPLLNPEVALGRAQRAFPDLAWPEFMVCAEYDGGWHDDRRRRRADLERQELLADAGWLVVRFRARDLFPEPLVAVARVLRRLTSRGYRHPGVIERAGSSGWDP
jgi:hypothetical protein